jgi:hypothetical protein
MIHRENVSTYFWLVIYMVMTNDIDIKIDINND